MNDQEFKKFCDDHMAKGGKLVPARLQAALALLERARRHPSLDLVDHVPAGSSGLESHETFGNLAHERLGLEPINKNHGRRSSSLSAWGQVLLDALKRDGFSKDGEAAVDRLQRRFANAIRAILETEPFVARIKGRTAEAVIADLLDQAEQRGRAGAVAQYLVGAKLQLRFPGLDVPRHAYNKGDRKRRGDDNARLADFEIAQAVIEVALGMPDEKHVDQVLGVLDETDAEVWLLVRGSRLAAWNVEIGRFDPQSRARVVVAAVESFVGQNISEMGAFSAKGKARTLSDLFGAYNEQWATPLGPGNLRVVLK